MRQLLLARWTHTAWAPARSWLRSFPDRPLAGARRLREPLADASGAVGGNQGA